MRRAVLLALVLVLGCKDADKQQAKEEAHGLKERATEGAKDLEQRAGAVLEEGKARAKAAFDQVGPLQTRMVELEREIAKAVDDVGKATSDETRATAVQALEKLRMEKADLARKLDQLRAKL